MIYLKMNKVINKKEKYNNHKSTNKKGFKAKKNNSFLDKSYKDPKQPQKPKDNKNLIPNKLKGTINYEFYDFISTGCLILDKKGNIINANSIGSKILDFKKSDLQKKEFINFIVPQFHEKFNSIFNNAIKTSSKQQLELKLIKADKSSFWAKLEIMYYGTDDLLMISLQDINEYKDVERALLENERKFRISLETLIDAFAIFSAVRENGIINDFKFEYINEVGCRLNKKTYGEQVGYSFLKVFPEHKNSKTFQDYVKTVETGDHLVKEIQFYENTLEGIIYKVFDIRAIKLGDGFAITWRDVTERKLAEKTIKKSLEEKDILLREIHHRIKNNMQVISSLLGIQSLYVKDNEAINILKDSQNRVKSMAIVHEKLYKSEDFTKINFKNYINDLAMHLLNSFDAESINLKINSDDFYLDLETAIPCGLIINELVTNSIKHAFPVNYIMESENENFSNPATVSQFENEICIDLISNEEESTLIVSDNGIGIPEDKNLESSDTLGFLIINTLISQIHGNIKLLNKKGTIFQIKFPNKFL